jgi:sodium/potassium-transporting ATPase subunit alpha
MNRVKEISDNLCATLSNKFNFAKKGPSKNKTESKVDTKVKAVVVNHQFHKYTTNEIENLFQTSIEKGLTDETAKNLLLKNGRNELRKPQSQFFKKLFKYCFSGFCWILWIGSFVCFIAWKPIGSLNGGTSDPTNLGLGILLLLVIGLQAVFEAFQDWSSGKVMKSIKNMMPADAHVIRNGVERKIPVAELVVGDLVILENGTKVPADLRLIESSDLKFDRSMITGESEAIDGHINCTDEVYSESKNISFMTTLVTNGNGKGIVTLTVIIKNLFL